MIRFTNIDLTFRHCSNIGIAQHDDSSYLSATLRESSFSQSNVLFTMDIESSEYQQLPNCAHLLELLFTHNAPYRRGVAMGNRFTGSRHCGRNAIKTMFRAFDARQDNLTDSHIIPYSVIFTARSILHFAATRRKPENTILVHVFKRNRKVALLSLQLAFAISSHIRNKTAIT